MKKLVDLKERNFYANVIANYCVCLGCLKTTECNWYFDIEELEEEFNVKIDKELLIDIESLILAYPIVLDVETEDDEKEQYIHIWFSTYTYYDYDTFLESEEEGEEE